MANRVRRSLVATGADRLIAAVAGRVPGLERLQPDISFYQKPTIRRTRRKGVRLDLDLGDYVEWSAYFATERVLRRKLYALAKPGDTVIDVGTNIGEVLLNLAARVGPPGRAVGFEPNPETHKRCKANLALNPQLNAELHPIALGQTEGELPFGRPCASNSGADRIVSAGEATMTVRVTTLDRFAASHAIERLDLLKIDVEGFELNVLRGGAETIRRFRPTLFVEVSDDNLRAQGSSATELIAWLEQRDYAVEKASDDSLVSSQGALDGSFMDVICRPR